MPTSRCKARPQALALGALAAFAAGGCVSGRWFVRWIEPSSLAWAAPWRELELKPDGRFVLVEDGATGPAVREGTWARHGATLTLRDGAGAAGTYRVYVMDDGERLKLYREMDGSDLVIVLNRHPAPPDRRRDGPARRGVGER